MESMYIDKDDLCELLKKAYEEGNYGYLDLKDTVAARIVEEYLSERKDKPTGKFEPYPYGMDEGIRLATTGIQVGLTNPGATFDLTI